MLWKSFRSSGRLNFVRGWQKKEKERQAWALANKTRAIRDCFTPVLRDLCSWDRGKFSFHLILPLSSPSYKQQGQVTPIFRVLEQFIPVYTYHKATPPGVHASLMLLFKRRGGTRSNIYTIGIATFCPYISYLSR